MSTSAQQARQRNDVRSAPGTSWAPRTIVNTALHVQPRRKNPRNGQGGWRNDAKENGNNQEKDVQNAGTQPAKRTQHIQRQANGNFSNPRAKENISGKSWRNERQGTSRQPSRTQRQWNGSEGRRDYGQNNVQRNTKNGEANKPVHWGGRQHEVKKDVNVSPQLTKKQKPKQPKFICPKLVEIEHVKSDEEWKMLDSLIQSIYESHRLTDERAEKAKELIDDLRNNIQKQIPGARLDVFGSIVNGSGTVVCDVDMCFRFEDEQPADKTPMDVIRDLAKILKKAYKGTGRVGSRFLPIEARIPILKMNVDGFDADISYYNEMALKNTVLLKRYCEWSPERLPQLILWIKKWAKDCDVNCSSSGTLSSYALTLMLIHYLQQCSPPVLPHWNMTDEELVEGYDFSSNDVNPNWSENTQSVGQLFVGFLDYYSRFNYAKLISILRKELIDKKLKAFNPDKVRSISIEDPYIDDFNPGYTVKDYKFIKVLAVFRCSREVFAGKFEEVLWNKETQERCMQFYEEVDEYEQAQIDGQIVIDDKLEKKKLHQSIKIFKAMVECRGEGNLKLLKEAYKKANKSVLLEDLAFFHDKDSLEAFLTHPFLEKHVNISEGCYFKIKEEAMELLIPLIESHTGFSNTDQNLTAGARRFIKVLQSHDRYGVKHDQFESMYLAIHGVKFDNEEKERNFGTADIDKVVKLIEKYGVDSRVTKAGMFLYRLENLVESGKNAQELTRIIQSLQLKDSNNGERAESPETPKEDQPLLPEGVRRFKHVLSQSMKPMDSYIFKKTYKFAYDTNLNQEERIRQFGVSTMRQISEKIKDHGVKVEKIGKDYKYTLVEEVKEREKPKIDKIPMTADVHPFFRT